MESAESAEAADGSAEFTVARRYSVASCALMTRAAGNLSGKRPLQPRRLVLFASKIRLLLIQALEQVSTRQGAAAGVKR